MKLLNIQYHNLTASEALDRIFALAETKDKTNVFFLNADCLYKAQKDEEYSDILTDADLLLPDGIGIKLATRLYGGQMKENCNGTDLSPRILREAARRKLKVFFLGGKEGVAQKAALKARAIDPEIEIVGYHSGYFANDHDMVEMINAASPDILFVALGVPLQEKWIFRNRQKLNARICLGVGAFLDYLSGSIPRAPVWMRKAHLEWFWRIFVDPKRMFKRYVIDGFGFTLYVLSKRLAIR